MSKETEYKLDLGSGAQPKDLLGKPLEAENGKYAEFEKLQIDKFTNLFVKANGYGTRTALAYLARIATAVLTVLYLCLMVTYSFNAWIFILAGVSALILAAGVALTGFKYPRSGVNLIRLSLFVFAVSVTVITESPYPTAIQFIGEALIMIAALIADAVFDSVSGKGMKISLLISAAVAVYIIIFGII